MSEALKSITIVGGGTAGWFAAAMIFGTRNRRNDGEDLRITLIESPTVPTVGVGEATTLSMQQMLDLLALDEKDFFRQCDASLKCAVRFDRWDRTPDGSWSSFFHPFESPHYLYGYPPAYHYHRRARAGKMPQSLAHALTPLTEVIDSGRAPREIHAPDLEGLASYGYHVDAGRFAAYLRDYCVTMGVEHIRDDVVDVSLDERGFVSSLALKERGNHPVEFVIDCSGFQGLIIRKALNEPFVDYRDSLPCDRALALQVPHLPDAKLPAYTTSTALGAGWSWSVPLYSRRGTGYVYSSSFATEEQATREYLDFLGADHADASPASIKMNVGRSRRSWVNNCVAVGLAGGFVEPLESTSIHFVQMSLRWLMDNFPDRDCSPPLRDAYNGLVQNLYEEIRDFIVMHYALSNRDDTPFWNAARNELKLSDWLTERLELWRYKMPSPTDCTNRLSLFSEWSFIYVLYGKHFFDGVTFALEHSLGDHDFDVFLAEIDQQRREMMARSPDHRQLLTALRQSAGTPWYRAGAKEQATLPAAALV
jgi:Tryptophan halogenase